MYAFVDVVDTALSEPHAKRMKRSFRDELVATRTRIEESANALGRELDRAATGIDPPSVSLELGKARRALQRFRSSTLGIALLAAAVGGSVEGLAATTVEALNSSTDATEAMAADLQDFCHSIEHGTDNRVDTDQQESDDEGAAKRLAASPRAEVRIKAPAKTEDPKLLAQLLTDRSIHVQQRAVKRWLSLYGAQSDVASLEDDARRVLASFADDNKMLGFLALDSSQEIRRTAIERIEDFSVLLDLSQSRRPEVRLDVAERVVLKQFNLFEFADIADGKKPDDPRKELLRSLAEDATYEVQQAALRRIADFEHRPVPNKRRSQTGSHGR